MPKKLPSEHTTGGAMSPPDMTRQDFKRITTLQKRRSIKPPKFSTEAGEDNLLIHAGNQSEILHSAALSEALGIVDRDLQDLFLNQLIPTCPNYTKNVAAAANKALAILHDLSPQNALEGMLAMQMSAVHNMAMEMTARAMIDNQTVDGVDRNVNRVTKLMRTFTAQIDTLEKLRGQRQQKVTVEHVHVHQGGQAIVGNVEHKGGEG